MIDLPLPDRRLAPSSISHTGPARDVLLLALALSGMRTAEIARLTLSDLQTGSDGVLRFVAAAPRGGRSIEP
jgi:integrase